MVQTFRSYGPGGHGATIGLQPKAYEVMVLLDSSHVEIWFHAFYQTTGHYEAWDSRYGQNYWFTVSEKHRQDEKVP